MEKRSIRLSSAEIAGLWEVYTQESMSVCLLSYFLHHNQDTEIKKLLQEAFDLSSHHVKKITELFQLEGIPIPDGFSEKDLDLTAPPLFYDTFALSLVYFISRMSMINGGFITANIARKDVLDFFVKLVQKYTALYQQSIELMLSKGVYDRPPMIPYPETIEYIDKLSYLNAFGKKRPLNVAEITQMFFNTERNYFSILLCMGLLQVVKDEEIHEFIVEGKKISEKQLNTFNDLFQREELLGNVATVSDVTDSTVNPFSNRLIVALFTALNGIDLTLLGHSISMSLRTDLVAYYQKYQLEILAYSAKGFKLMVERGWMQKPPHAPDRRKLQKLE
ncbi:DUF3231 family protein [Bacillus rubiinfantis]|uniref:DUF3231 family protein n=1 Tax=Bacillus rubiinfantis TaxID=1499680 RepID=UPI0005A6E7CE|nr:DUF3231 family protein [Bacillus rubiinfantis]